MADVEVEFRPIADRQSPYQRVELGTAPGVGLMMLLNDQIQFAQVEEKGYHRALVWPAMQLMQRVPADVLVLGGGDGLAVREILKFPVRSVTLVDIDPEVLRFAKTLPLSKLNQNALFDPRVRVLQQDATSFLTSAVGPWNVVVADFPDPTYPGIQQLYEDMMIGRIRSVLAPGGVLSFHGTSEPKTVKALAKRLRQWFGSVKHGKHKFPFIGDTSFFLARN